MPNLMPEDKKKFEEYLQLSSEIHTLVQVGTHLTNPQMIKDKLGDLKTYAAAYEATKLKFPDVNLTRPEHQRILSVALAVQRKQIENLSREEQLIQLQLQCAALRVKEKNRQSTKQALVVGQYVVPHPIAKTVIGITASITDSKSSNEEYCLTMQDIKQLNKLTPRDFLQEKIGLNKEVLQHIMFQQESVKNQTKIFMNAYHIPTLDEKTQGQIEQLIEQFLYTRQTEKTNIERATVAKNFSDAKEFFGNIATIGANTRNSTLATIGQLGMQGASIAYNIANVAGIIPGLVAPTGIGLLLPGANIVFGAVSLFSMLSNDREDNTDLIINAIKAISEQIKALHEEMRTSFKRIDERLVKIHEDLLNGLSRLESIIHADVKSFKTMLAQYAKSHTEDFNQLVKLLEKGFTDIRLDEFNRLVRTLESYTTGNLKDLDDAKATLIKTTEDLTHDWLLKNLSGDMFTSRWHYNSDEKTFRQIANMSKFVLTRNVELMIGFLAKFASDTLGIKDIPVSLPNLQLLTTGIEGVLKARKHLIDVFQYEEFDKKGEQLHQIKATAGNITRCIDTLMQNGEYLFKALFKIYNDGLKTLEQQALNLLIEKEKIRLNNRKQPLSNITLSSIKPVDSQNSNPNLDAKHFLAALPDTLIPALLVEAARQGVVTFQADYTATQSTPKAWHGDGGNWNYPTYRECTMPTYSTRLMCKVADASELFLILNVAFHANIPVTHHWLSGKGNVQDDDSARSSFIQSQNSIPLASLCANYWHASTLSSVDLNKKLEEELAKVSSDVITKMTNKKWTATKERQTDLEFKKQIASLKEDISFISATDQLIAARALIIAYCKLLGFPQELTDKISKNLICETEPLIANSTLFTSLKGDSDQLLKEITTIILAEEKQVPSRKPIVSLIRLKAAHVSNQITQFSQTHLLREIKKPVDVKLVDQKSNITEMSPLVELIQPYREHVVYLKTWCTHLLDTIKVSDENIAIIKICKAHYENVKLNLTLLNNALLNNTFDHFFEIIEKLKLNIVSLHNGLLTLNIHSFSEKPYNLRIDILLCPKRDEQLRQVLTALCVKKMEPTSVGASAIGVFSPSVSGPPTVTVTNRKLSTL